MSGVQVKLGSTRLLESGALRGKRVGLVSNPASVDHRLLHLVDLVLADQAIDLVALFGPQHGFRSDVQDNMIESPHRSLRPVRRNVSRCIPFTATPGNPRRQCFVTWTLS